MLLAGFMFTVVGCDDAPDSDGSGANSSSSGSGSGGGTSTGTYNDKTGSISDNHGHSVTLTAAQQAAGKACTLTLSTASGHDHLLYLGATNVITIRGGTKLTVPSTVDSGHHHDVTFN
jgi:hypothetical protein